MILDYTILYYTPILPMGEGLGSREEFTRLAETRLVLKLPKNKCPKLPKVDT